jgi:hypothetical protein
MKVYVAAKSRHWPFFSSLRAAGVPITATWLDWEHNHNRQSEPTDVEWREHADRCLREAMECDVLLLYAQEEERQNGALLECGAALAAGRQVYLVSPYPWAFLRNHPRVKSFDTLDAAVADLLARSKQTNH